MGERGSSDATVSLIAPHQLDGLAVPDRLRYVVRLTFLLRSTTKAFEVHWISTGALEGTSEDIRSSSRFPKSVTVMRFVGC